MKNRSHKNSGFHSMNQMNREGRKHSSFSLARNKEEPESTKHLVLNKNCFEFLKEVPDDSVQLIICDPPYNILMADWDKYSDYISWCDMWLKETHRVLKPTGNLVL